MQDGIAALIFSKLAKQYCQLIYILLDKEVAFDFEYSFVFIFGSCCEIKASNNDAITIL